MCPRTKVLTNNCWGLQGVLTNTCRGAPGSLVITAGGCREYLVITAGGLQGAVHWLDIPRYRRQVHRLCRDAAVPLARAAHGLALLRRRGGYVGSRLRLGGAARGAGED